MGQLESYIDRLNATIEWLESEQLTVTNNIINLKWNYNKAKVEYDELQKRIHIESKRHGELLMTNIRLTTQQNKETIKKIREDEEKNRLISKENSLKETELLTKMSEVCQKEEDCNQKTIEINERERKCSIKTKEIENKIIEFDISNGRLDSLIEQNENKEKRLNIILDSYIEKEKELEKWLKDIQSQKDILENQYDMKFRDLERRESVIIQDKIKIDSEWKALKRAKEHIDNLKQGNQ